MPYGWNLEGCEEEGEHVLLNKNRTSVRVAANVDIDLGEIMDGLERVGFPLSFTDGLKEIYFTMLRTTNGVSLLGDYRDGVVRVSTDSSFRSEINSTVIHEIAHYVDEVHEISTREKIITEKRTSAKHMPNAYAMKKDIREYVACGFEVYYLGTRKERGEMRRKNPKLFNVIKYLDKKAQ